ncbi:MAG TPA: hypothetical protein VFG19_15680 [Geobacteraceae bacterium]|nr:hypothetical protein [Geobacteraceae bacterium]
MFKIRKREGDNLEILEVEEILKQRGYSRVFDAGPDQLQPKQYIKRLYSSEILPFSGEELYQLLWNE